MVRTTELTLKCPDMKLQEDEIIVHQTLAGSPGIGLVETDFRAHTVHVVTANQDGGLDVRQRLEGAGYPALD